MVVMVVVAPAPMYPKAYAVMVVVNPMMVVSDSVMVVMVAYSVMVAVACSMVVGTPVVPSSSPPSSSPGHGSLLVFWTEMSHPSFNFLSECGCGSHSHFRNWEVCVTVYHAL